MERSTAARLRRQAGFTLVELLVVIAILGILAGVVSIRIFRQIDKARVAKAKAQIEQFKLAITEYYTDMGDYPPDDTKLRALVERPNDETSAKLWDGPYLDIIPLDPWKNEYEYHRTDSGSYEIVCYGKDGAEGGEGVSADVSSRIQE